MCLWVESFASEFTGCWSWVKLHLWDARAQQSCDFTAVHPPRQSGLQRAQQLALSKKLTGRQARQIGQVERRGKPQAGAECKFSTRQLLSSNYASFLWGPAVLQIASACRIIVLSAKSCPIKPEKITDLLSSASTCKAGKIFAKNIYLCSFHPQAKRLQMIV